MNEISLGNTAIRQLDGLYSLNDLHQAAGGEVKHQPTRFMRNDQTQALIAEIGNSPEMVSFKTATGRHGGTYVCRELVIAYAAWISAAFHLKVIRVFLDTALAHHRTEDLCVDHWILGFTHDRQPVVQLISRETRLISGEALQAATTDALKTLACTATVLAHQLTLIHDAGRALAKLTGGTYHERPGDYRQGKYEAGS
jgi:hypothetical protein